MSNINKVNPGLGFHHIALKVKDFQKSYDFYTKVLGLTPVIEWGEGDSHVQMLDLGDGGILELFAGGGNLAENGLFMHFAMKADNVDEIYEKALAAGATSKMAPKVVDFDSKPYKISARIAFVKGFDNEELEFFKVL